MKKLLAAAVLGLGLTGVAASAGSAMTSGLSTGVTATRGAALIQVESNGWGDRINKDRYRYRNEEGYYRRRAYVPDYDEGYAGPVRYGYRPPVEDRPFGFEDDEAF